MRNFLIRVFIAFAAVSLFSVRSNAADSLTVTFRVADPSKSYVRAFVPADFNNWGPNNNGTIDSNASCRMQYDAAQGWWKKSYRLRVGDTRYYKFYFHLNQSGSQSTWISDPANGLTDGSAYQNSKMTISDPMFFETLKKTSGGGVTGLTAGIFWSKTVTKVQVVVNGDSTDVTSAYDAASGILSWTVPGAPVSASAAISIVAYDNTGNRTYFEFWQPPTPPAYTVPEWSKHAVWYQIFPERFRNGDTGNDPVRSTLENWQSQPVGWSISSWTKDWYARDSWERQQGSDFYSSVFNRRLGGDLQGVVDKLDYLDSLGINAIYLNPIFYARSLHKYDGRAHHHVDPYFGPDPNGDIALMASETLEPSTWHWTSADTLFLGLLREAHRRGIAVIIDGVFNHTGVDFPAFQDIVRNQQASIYKDWYIVTAWDNPATPQNEFAYHGWYGYSSLPEFADTPDGTNVAPGPKKYIFDITRRWMDPNGDGDPSDGIDGWRLDTVPDVPINFWTDWNTYVRSINPEAYTVAENWGDASATVTQGRFSGTMNYRGCAIPVYNFLAKGSESPSAFAADISSVVSAYGTDAALANQGLLDSHDTERLASMIVNAPIAAGFQTVNNPRASTAYSVARPTARDRRVQRLMVLAQVTIPGAPMIYYGDEAGMWGANDPDDRMPMSWPDLTMAPQATDPRGFARTPDDVNFDPTVSAAYRRMIAQHRFSPALQTGAFHTIVADDAAGTLVFSRTEGSDNALVVMNRDTASHTVQFGISGLVPPGQHLFCTGSTEDDISSIIIDHTDTSVAVTLPGISGAIFHVSSGDPQTVMVDAGWSMVSLPRQGSDSSVAVLFPSAVAGAFSYSGAGYQYRSAMSPGTGYWVKHARPDTITVDGADLFALTIPVNEGWNLVGSISTNVTTSAVTSTPPGLVASPFYEFAKGYRLVQNLLPGKGYWIKAKRAGTITLTSSALRSARIPR